MERYPEGGEGLNESTSLERLGSTSLEWVGGTSLELAGSTAHRKRSPGPEVESKEECTALEQPHRMNLKQLRIPCFGKLMGGV